jgi:hypothetical protein
MILLYSTLGFWKNFSPQMAQTNTDLIPLIRRSLDIDLEDDIRYEELNKYIAAHINQLIQTDFEKLVSLLYRIDISEKKLKHLLQQSRGQDAGKIIADLILERQEQKIKSRSRFKQQDDDIINDEKW